MKFNLGCQLSYSIAQPSTFIFNVGVINNTYQKVLQEDLQTNLNVDIEEYIDPQWENRYFRVNVQPGNLHLSYQATVESSYFHADPNAIGEVDLATLPMEIIPYLYPSRYCPSDQLLRLAASEFGHLLPGYSKVTAICNWIYDNVTYLSGSSGPHTSAYDTVTERVGVCRDFAHLGIAFCRALAIPARFVSAYAYGLTPPDFHACFEAYLDNRWYLFDPSRLAPLNAVVRISTGRDAADVSFATIFGAVQMEQMKVFMDHEIEPDSSEETPAPQIEAIAISA